MPSKPYTFRDEDFTYVQRTLLAKEGLELLEARNCFNINTEAPPYARKVGFETYEGTGNQAEIKADGAMDIPIAGENIERIEYKVFTIPYGIKYTQNEIALARASQQMTGKSDFALESSRIAHARRLIAEAENKLVWTGNTKNSVKGLFNWTGITKEDVSVGTTGVDDIAKKKWQNKTSLEIYRDIHAACSTIEKDGLYKPKALILSPESYWNMLKPTGTVTDSILLQWLESKGIFFEKVIKTNAIHSANNGLNKEAFAIIDSSPENMEIYMPQDLTVTAPYLERDQSYSMIAYERTTGLVIKRPKAVYIGTGI